MRETLCATCSSVVWSAGGCVRCAPLGGRPPEPESWPFCNECGALRGEHGIECPQEGQA